MALLVAQTAAGAEFDVGDGLRLRWDNTVRATLGFRVAPQAPALLANANADDGDRAFTQGLNSERLDIISELDFSADNWGIDLSGEGFYDAVYHQRSANRSPATFNPVGVSHTGFPDSVVALEGGQPDLLNANIHGQTTLAGVPVTLRLGRQTLLWGESLFSTENGIAAGQAPVDGDKALSQPLAEANELFLPVAQASIGAQLLPWLHTAAYLQGEWRRDRLPGVASYFSTSDVADVGGQRLFGPVGATVPRGRDRTPGSGLGQFGAALQASTGGLDLGIYALRFDAKSPLLYTAPGGGLGHYGLLFPRGIGLYGTSFSTYLGASNLAGEVSLRTAMPLVSRAPALGVADAALAAGKTLHAQLSTITTLPPGRLWQGASLLAEVFGNDVLTIDHDAAARAAGRDRCAISMRASFAPQYFEVFPQLDLTVPLGLGWNVAGNSGVLADQVAGTADAEVGINATWRVVWHVVAAYTRFIGSPARQPLADRDYVRLSVSRTF